MSEPYQMRRPITSHDQMEDEGIAWGEFYAGRGPEPVMLPWSDARAARSRARHLLVDDAIPVNAIPAATDTECYACGRSLSDTEGKVGTPIHGLGEYGLYCEPPCAQRKATA